MANISVSQKTSLTKREPKEVRGFVKFVCPGCKATIQTDFRMEKCPQCNKALSDPYRTKSRESGMDIVEEVKDEQS